MKGNPQVIRAICRRAWPASRSKPTRAQMEAIDQIVDRTIRALAGGASKRDVTAWFIKMAHDQAVAEGVDPDSFDYETRIAVAQRTIMACLAVAEECGS